jgi:outer membrane biosynthesis protein TonB
MSSPFMTETTSDKGFKINSVFLFILTSLGIHAVLIFLALPTLSKIGQPDKQNQELGVGVIELNAAEQSRLPSFSDPSLETPQYSDLNSFNSSLFDTSSLPSSSYFPNTSNMPLLPPPPDYNSTIAFGNNVPIITTTPPSLPALPASKELPTLPYNQSNLPNYPYNPNQTTPNLPSEDQRRQQLDFEEPQRSTTDARRWLEQRSREASNNTPSTDDPNGRTQPQTIEQNSVVDPMQAHRDKIARRLTAEAMANAEGLVKDEMNEEEARKRDVDWRIQQQSARPQQITIAGTYPRAACLRKLEGQAVYGVVVNPQGQIVNSPQQPYLIKSADYGVFTQQALKDIQGQSFPNQTGQPQPYRVTVNYTYNPKVCPALAIARPEPNEVQPTRESSEPQKQPATEATTTPTQPKPSNNSSPQQTEAVEPNQSQPIDDAVVPKLPQPNSENPVFTPAAPTEDAQPVQSEQNSEDSPPSQTTSQKPLESNAIAPKTQTDPSSAPVSFRKPLGTFAPSKTEETSSNESSESSSTEQEASTSEED